VVASQKCELEQNRKNFNIAVQGHPRSSIFGTNRKRIYDFLLLINSNLCPILHHFWDTAAYWLKIAYFSYPFLFGVPLPMFPLEFRGEINREETKESWGYTVVKVAW